MPKKVSTKRKYGVASRLIAKGIPRKQIMEQLRQRYGSGISAKAFNDMRKARGGSVPRRPTTSKPQKKVSSNKNQFTVTVQKDFDITITVE